MSILHIQAYAAYVEINTTIINKLLYRKSIYFSQKNKNTLDIKTLLKHMNNMWSIFYHYFTRISYRMGVSDTIK